MKKYSSVQSALLTGAKFSSYSELPILNKSNFIPTKVISFDKATTSSKDKWVHFYIDDKRFERVWNNPVRYINMLKKFEGVITPDFSMYVDLPIIVQVWNAFRNRAIAYWLQNNGANIVPNIRWGDERSYRFAFDGIEEGGTVAIGSHGNIKTRMNRYYFERGLEKMVEVIKPETIVCVGSMPDDIFGRYNDMEINLINIPSEISVIHSKEEM